MEVKDMKLLKPAFLLATVVVLGGCTATITPRGDIYTEAYFPSTVVVESAPVVWVHHPPRPAPRPMGPYASSRRYHGPAFPGHGPGPHRPFRPHGPR